MLHRAAMMLALAVTGMAGGVAADPLDAAVGERLLRRPWVGAGASTRSADGLGPLYNARACTSCHVLADGRGAVPDGAGPGGVVLRLLHPAGCDPVYGRQIQTAAMPGMDAEATVASTRAGTGFSFTLSALAQGPLAGATVVSPRMPPALRGLGLLEAVPAASIRAAADPDDRDGDGVRGVAAVAAAGDADDVGRFGWKGEHATLPDQVAAAFSLDLGLSTRRFPEPWGDCTPAQVACRTAPQGDGPREGPEVHPRILDAIVAHLRQVDVPPAATDVTGARLFASLGCAACHAPEQVAVVDGVARPFRPYTDLLLHDMGDGLADAVAPSLARLWRTAPLWGLGRAVADGAGLLHDGRARDLRAAIGWHDGEALGARQRFERATPRDRAALISFLETL